MPSSEISWWRREDQAPPFYASKHDEDRIRAAFPKRSMIMVFCEDRGAYTICGYEKARGVTWEDIEILGIVDYVRCADLVLVMKPAGFVHVLKDRFGLRGTLRSIW